MHQFIHYALRRGWLRALDSLSMRLLGERYAKWRSWKRIEKRIRESKGQQPLWPHYDSPDNNAWARANYGLPPELGDPGFGQWLDMCGVDNDFDKSDDC